MDFKEKSYFERMRDYKIKKITTYPDEIMAIDFLSTKIRNYAKDVLNQQISSKNAKEEISNLVKTINELNKR